MKNSRNHHPVALLLTFFALVLWLLAVPGCRKEKKTEVQEEPATKEQVSEACVNARNKVAKAEADKLPKSVMTILQKTLDRECGTGTNETETPEPPKQEEPAPKEKVTGTCLDARKKLAQAEADNLPKNVTDVLRKTLDRECGVGQSGSKNSESSKSVAPKKTDTQGG